MTREEAIADIRDNIKPVVGGKSLDMAIQALTAISEKNTDGDLISRQAVITMLNKIENAVEDGDGFQFNEWVEYAKDIPSFEKTTLSEEKTTITDGDLITEIDKLPRIKVGNSNSPTVKYCIDEVLLYDLLERYKAEKTAEWVELDDYPNEDWECDNCGFVITGVEEPYRYCPNCGKKMWK